jgi:hypothetical protein
LFSDIEKVEESIWVYRQQDNSLLASNFNSDEISSTEDGTQLVWKQLRTAITDQATELGVGLAFDNFSPFEITQFDSIEFYLQVEGVNIVKVGLKNLALGSGFNAKFEPALSLTFIDENIVPSKVQEVIEIATSNFAAKKDISYGVAGPIRVSNAGWIGNISENLKLSMKYSAAPSQETTTSSSTSGLMDSLKGSLGKSSIVVKILADRMRADFGINLPSWEKIKPPKDISFPYETKISVYGQNHKVLDAQISPVTIKRQNAGFLVETAFEVVPVNTENAANSLAAVINPVLDGSPSVFFFNLGISCRNQGFRVFFTWTTHLQMVSSHFWRASSISEHSSS